MTKYLDRATATAFIRAVGIPMGDNRLADLAYEGRGPRFAMINGRAVYTEQWLAAWIEAQAARSVKRYRASKPARTPKRRRRSPSQSAAAP
jgi:hypothetical protein